MAGNRQRTGAQTRICVLEQGLYFLNANSRLPPWMQKAGWNMNRFECFPQQMEIIRGGQSGAASVSLPFVEDELGAWHNIEHPGRIRQTGRGATVLRPAPVAILRPKSMGHKAKMPRSTALRVAAVAVAILRRPGKREPIIVELPRRTRRSVLRPAAQTEAGQSGEQARGGEFGWKCPRKSPYSSSSHSNAPRHQR